MKVRCPICKKQVEWENNPFRPFCSDRCRLTDLGNWAAGKYRIEQEEKTEEEPKEPAGDTAAPHSPDA